MPAISQSTFFRSLTFAGLVAIVLGSVCPGPALADVTVNEQTKFNFVIIKAHGDSTEMTTTDKQRRDSSFHCDGFMSLLCGNTQSGEIIRLDRDVQWTLEPKKKEYREQPFLTAAQRQALELQMQAQIEKLKQCPAASPQARTAPAPDTQNCTMSPPKFAATTTESHSTFAGHGAQLTQLTLTQSCVNPNTGDSCDFLIEMDSWLTDEKIAGLDDRRVFQKAYLHKLGLDDTNSAMQKQMQQFLAPYAGSLKQLAAKAGVLKGYPLKSSVRIAFGGEHCAAAHQQANAGAGDSGDTGGGPTSSLGAVASNLGSKLGGMFGKKKSDTAASGTTSSDAMSPLPPGMMQAAQFSTETTSISDAPVAAGQFEVPADWKLVAPPPQPAEKSFSCPKSGA